MTKADITRWHSYSVSQHMFVVASETV